MYNAQNERERKRETMEGIEISNQELIRTFGEKKNNKYVGKIGSGHHQTSEEERLKEENIENYKCVKIRWGNHQRNEEKKIKWEKLKK